jgi:hypothetical protein
VHLCRSREFVDARVGTSVVYENVGEQARARVGVFVLRMLVSRHERKAVRCKLQSSCVCRQVLERGGGGEMGRVCDRHIGGGLVVACWGRRAPTPAPTLHTWVVGDENVVMNLIVLHIRGWGPSVVGLLHEIPMTRTQTINMIKQ